MTRSGDLADTITGASSDNDGRCKKSYGARLRCLNTCREKSKVWLVWRGSHIASCGSPLARTRSSVSATTKRWARSRLRPRSGSKRGWWSLRYSVKSRGWQFTRRRPAMRGSACRCRPRRSRARCDDRAARRRRFRRRDRRCRARSGLPAPNLPDPPAFAGSDLTTAQAALKP